MEQLFNQFRYDTANSINNIVQSFGNFSEEFGWVPTSDEKIKDLPVFAYREVDKTCSICLDDFKLGDLIPYFHCQHYLHYHCFRECYQNWISGRNKEGLNCPQCRQEVMTQKLVDCAKEKRRSFLKRTYVI